MLYIQKQEEPDFLVEFKKENPTKDYDSKEFARYRGLLNAALRKEQKGLCAYCCSRIEEGGSHNEHIEPRHPGTFTSKRTLDYSNIVASCNRDHSCGRYRGNKYESEKFVIPTDSNCESKFDYNFDGVMDGEEYTIGSLNLNSYELQNARKSVIRQLQTLNGNKDLLDRSKVIFEEVGCVPTKKYLLQ